jgi:hypothetical protein
MGFMLLRSLILLCLPFAFLAAQAEDSILPRGWRMAAYPFDRAALDRPSADGNVQLADGVRETDAEHERGFRQFDVSAFLAVHVGVEFPKGAIAVFDENSQKILCAAPDSYIGLLDVALLSTGCCFGPTQSRVVATLVTFECGSSVKLQGLSYRRLKSVAGSTWHEVEQLTCTAQSGQQRSVIHRLSHELAPKVAADEKPKDAPACLDEGELGALLAVEPVIGPDGRTVDMNYHFTRRFASGGLTDVLDATGMVTLTAGVPMIVESWPFKASQQIGTNTQRARVYALVLRIDIVNSDGVNVFESFALSAREQRERKDAENAAKTQGNAPKH